MMAGKKNKDKAKPQKKKEEDFSLNLEKKPPGFKLKHVLRLKGHKCQINGISWSPDLNMIVSASIDEAIRIWGIEAERVFLTLRGHQSDVSCVKWSPDGEFIASGSRDNTVRIWDALTGELLKTLTGHKRDVFDVAWSPDSKFIASASLDSTIRIWDTETFLLQQIFTVHSSSVNSLAWSPDGKILASASHDNTIRLRDTETWEALAVLEGHKQSVNCLNWSPDGDILVSASDDKTVRLWDVKASRQMDVLEGHNAPVYGVSFSSDGWLIASRSQDKIIRLFISDSWQKIGDISILSDTAFSGLAFHPNSPLFATLSERDHAITIWEYDLEKLLCAIPEIASLRYATAKIALIGDFEVNKTSLGHKLSHNEFEEYSPPKGERFFIVSGVLKKREDEMEREAIIFDLSGKTDLRLSNLLILDDVDFYLPLSDLDTITKMMEKIEDQIHWEDLTSTIKTNTFKHLKEYVLSLRADEKWQEGMLFSPTDLKERLEAKYPDWKVSDVKLMTAVRQLETHGFVKIICDSHEKIFILLFPDLLANLAFSFFLEAKVNPDWPGRLDENRLLRGEYEFSELKGLSEKEQIIILDETVTFLLEKNICFFETINKQTFLCFPSLINEKRPALKDIEIFEDVSYHVCGLVDRVYASMAVLMGNTNIFLQKDMWQNQAEYESLGGGICGFRQSMANQDGEVDLVLYYSFDTPKHVQLLFRALFQSFLMSHKNVEITCNQPITLPKCKKQEKIVRSRTSFEKAIIRLKRLILELNDGEGEMHPACFISYAWSIPEHEHFVVRLAKDLQNAGIDVLLDRWWNTSSSSINKFTDQIKASEFVLVLGMKELRLKYEMHGNDLVVASELELINERLKQHKQFGQTVFPLLISGNPNISFTSQLKDLDFIDFRYSTNYFINLFDLIWQIYNLPLNYPHLKELRESIMPSKNIN